MCRPDGERDTQVSTDIDRVAELVHRYADAVGRRDEAGWASTWAETAVWELPGSTVEGREAIVDTWRSVMSGFSTVVQRVTDGTSDIDDRGATGSGRWHVSEHAVRTDGRPVRMDGHYDDDYVRGADGGWVFARRSLTVHAAGDPSTGAGRSGDPDAPHHSRRT